MHKGKERIGKCSGEGEGREIRREEKEAGSGRGWRRVVMVEDEQVEGSRETVQTSGHAETDFKTPNVGQKQDRFQTHGRSRQQLPREQDCGRRKKLNRYIIEAHVAGDFKWRRERFIEPIGIIDNDSLPGDVTGRLWFLVVCLIL